MDNIAILLIHVAVNLEIKTKLSIMYIHKLILDHIILSNYTMPSINKKRNTLFRVNIMYCKGCLFEGVSKLRQKMPSVSTSININLGIEAPSIFALIEEKTKFSTAICLASISGMLDTYRMILSYLSLLSRGMNFKYLCVGSLD